MPWQPVFANRVPEGRIEIVGTIIDLDVEESDLGWRRVMTVESDEGWGIKGTLPTGLGKANIGDRIIFRAKIKPVSRSFGYFSRPTKARFEKDDDTPKINLPKSTKPTNLPF